MQERPSQRRYRVIDAFAGLSVWRSVPSGRCGAGTLTPVAARVEGARLGCSTVTMELGQVRESVAAARTARLPDATWVRELQVSRLEP